MSYEVPEQRLMYIKQRQREAIAEAAANRSAPSRRAHLPVRGDRFVGLHIRLGSYLIAIGRTLCEEDALGRTPARS